MSRDIHGFDISRRTAARWLFALLLLVPASSLANPTEVGGLGVGGQREITLVPDSDGSVLFAGRGPVFVPPGHSANASVGASGARILRLSPQGTTSTFFGRESAGTEPPPGTVLDFVFAPDGDLYVVAVAPAAVYRVARDGSVSVVAGPDELGPFLADDALGDVDVGRDGSVYFLDNVHGQILRIAPGAEVSVLAEGGFGRVGGFAVDAAGFVYAWSRRESEYESGYVLVRIAPDGAVVALDGTLQFDFAPLQRDRVGNVYANLGGRLVRFAPDGTRVVIQDRTTTTAYVVGPDGLAYVMDPRGSLYRFGADDQLEFLLARYPFLGDFHFADEDGRMYSQYRRFDSPRALVFATFSPAEGVRLWGASFLLRDAAGMALTASGSVLALGRETDNVLRIDANDEVHVAVSDLGDAAGGSFDAPVDVAVGGDDSVYVLGEGSRNVLRVAKQGVVAEVVRLTASVHAADFVAPAAVAVDAAGNIYVGDGGGGRVVRFAPDGSEALVLDRTAPDAGIAVAGIADLEVSDDGWLYVVGRASNNVVAVRPDGGVEELIGAAGDGLGNVLADPAALVVNGDGDVVVAGTVSNNVFEVAADGSVRLLADASGTGPGNRLVAPNALALDRQGRVYVSAGLSENVLRVDATGAVDVVVTAGDVRGPRRVLVDADDRVWVLTADKVVRYDPAVPTRTPTLTRTIPPTPTATATATSTATRTATATEAVAPTLTPTPTPTARSTPTSGPVCAGDCDGDGSVTVDEIVGIVNIALGVRSLDQCRAADGSGDGSITVEEIITAAGFALQGCAAARTPVAP